MTSEISKYRSISQLVVGVGVGSINLYLRRGFIGKNKKGVGMRNPNYIRNMSGVGGITLTFFLFWWEEYWEEHYHPNFITEIDLRSRDGS